MHCAQWPEPLGTFVSALNWLIGHRWWRGWRSSPPHIAEPRRRRGPSPSPRARSFAVARLSANHHPQTKSKRSMRRPCNAPCAPASGRGEAEAGCGFRRRAGDIGEYLRGVTDECACVSWVAACGRRAPHLRKGDRIAFGFFPLHFIFIAGPLLAAVNGPGATLAVRA